MFRISDLRRRRRQESYPADLPDRIVQALGDSRVSFQNLRRQLYGMTKLRPEEADSLTRALADLEKSGRIRRFGRGHGATFYEFTFYENVPESDPSHT